jgi:hypothetical protein
VTADLCVLFDHIVDIVLTQWEVLRELIGLTEDIDLLLEVAGDQSHTVSANFVDDAAIRQDGLTADEDDIDLGHVDRHCAVIDY